MLFLMDLPKDFDLKILVEGKLILTSSSMNSICPYHMLEFSISPIVYIGRDYVYWEVIMCFLFLYGFKNLLNFMI